MNLRNEDEEEDLALIGVPHTWGEGSLWLEEVTPQATWNGTLSECPYADITRVEFSSTYELDLLLVAGPPPGSAPEPAAPDRPGTSRDPVAVR